MAAPPAPPIGTDSSPRAALAFSAFTIDLRGGQLLCAGRPVPLRPKTWAVLVYLAQRPGTLISRDELLDAVWPDVAVTPDTLTKSIGELRVALGDDTRQPRFIETVHRRGFRFLDTPSPQVEAVAAEAATGDQSRPFVGRESEMQRLTACFERASRGERQMVFLSGAAGVGKSTLVEAFLQAPALRAAAAIGAGASIEQHGEREAYMPVLEALERLARGAQRERVTALLGAAAPSWLAQLPWLAEADAALWARSRQASRPERMLREAVALLEGLATDVPLVLALEDLHWSDPSTIDLLARIGQRREPARLLILVTYRPAEVAVHDHPLGTMVRSLRGQRRCVELPVHDLSGQAVQRYLEMRFAGATLPPGLAEGLHQHTDGNPLFLRAVVDHMTSRGWILDTAPGWSFAAMPAQPAFGVPDDARDMVGLQIDSLPPTDRRVLEAAGVAGRDCSPGLLAAVLERDLAEVEGSCETLARGQRFLRLVGDGAAPRYGFVHELYRQAVYHDIPTSRRQRLHRRVGAALEAELGARAAEQAAALANHCEQGGDHAAALDYLAVAAERARRRAAPREACEYLEHALELVANLPDPAERRRRELALLVALAPVVNERSGTASAALLETCERALALCDHADGLPLRFAISYALCHVYAMRADVARVDVVSRAIDDLAERLGGTEHRLLADSIRCRTAMYQGRFADSCREAQRVFAAAAAGTTLPETTFGADPLVASRNHFAVSAWMLGDLPAARAATAQLAATARDAAPFTRTAAGFFVGLLAVLDRDAPQVLQSVEPILVLAEEHGFAQWLPMLAALRGWAQVRLGEIDAGMDGLRQARATHAANGSSVFSTFILAFLAEGCLRRGDIDGGLRFVDEGLAVSAATMERMCAAELWRLKGELLLAAGGRRRAQGEAALQRAIEEARADQARMLGLRVAVSLARVWMETDRSAAARDLVGAALAGIAGDDHDDLREAHALLAPPAQRPRRRR